MPVNYFAEYVRRAVNTEIFHNFFTRLVKRFTRRVKKFTGLVRIFVKMSAESGIAFPPLRLFVLFC